MAIPLDLQLRSLRRKIESSTIYKSDDETVTSDTTLTMDSKLWFLASPNTNYQFSIDVWFDTPETADFKFGLTGPASPTRMYCRIDAILPDNVSSTLASASMFHGALKAYETTGILIESDIETEAGYIHMSGILHNGANSGAFGFTWAQGTSDAGNTTVLAGSSLTYRAVS